MLCNILLLNFQVTKICNTCAFYMHLVMKCIRALDVNHNTQMNRHQQVPSWLGLSGTGGKYRNKNLHRESPSNIH